MLKGIRISLANKCQLLFGLAVVLVMTAALFVVGWRMQTLVERGPERRAQDLAELWLAGQIELGEPLRVVGDGGVPPPPTTGVELSLVHEGEFDLQAAADPFLDEALDGFERGSAEPLFRATTDEQGRPYFRYVRAVRQSDLDRMTGGFNAQVDATSITDPLRRVLVIQLRDNEAATQQLLNRIYIVAAGLFAGLLAIAVFYFITTRIILSPVRVLRGYAERVSKGDLSIRSDINTGDEFEQLSDMFNTMLESLKAQQDKLEAANKTLDLKLVNLAESNIALFEANKMKGEFLANVSHELRTPLNSIIGFAEIMQETLADRTGPMDEKRKRYAANIITSSRRLLELINDLLDLAKIEAGKMELRLSSVSVADTLEGLVTLIRPQAQKGGVELVVRVEPRLPLVETDPGKLQQILFNFLANAVKFTPPGGTVTLSAELPRQRPRPGASGYANGHADTPDRGRVRFAVSDTGPGIPEDDQERIFEKFTQLDPGVTKSHGGTGLGLTISRELAEMLNGHLTVTSRPGHGATFSLTLPVVVPDHERVGTSAGAGAMTKSE